jgi:enoyl-CoA hydratase
MPDIDIRIVGRAGRITLNRPAALNALTYDMAMAIDAVLLDWADNPLVSMVIIDAVGERAFCAGGDIQHMYDTAKAGDFAFGRQFWADEYRLNARIFHFPKPFVAFMQGFNMGGGVGVSCHGSHRIVCENSQIAMPECSIGLVPDVGGSLLLARAPGRLGEYLGCTGARMSAGDAIYAGFADYFIPYEAWNDLIQHLETTGNIELIDQAAQPAPVSDLAQHQAWIDRHFAGSTIVDVINGLDGSDFAGSTEKALRRNSPLSVAAALDLVRRVRGVDTVEYALKMEYRFTYRAASNGDFVEGIRAAVIDKDRAPKWQHARLEDACGLPASRMLFPLQEHELNLGDNI